MNRGIPKPKPLTAAQIIEQDQRKQLLLEQKAALAQKQAELIQQQLDAEAQAKAEYYQQRLEIQRQNNSASSRGAKKPSNMKKQLFEDVKGQTKSK